MRAAPFVLRATFAGSSCFVIFASASLAQAVWKVGSSPSAQFADLQPAVDAAALGDFIVVESGAYSGFTITGKPLTIVAENVLGASIAGTCTVRSVPVGASFTLRNVKITGTSGGASTPGVAALRALDCAGPVVLESSVLVGGSSIHAAPGIEASGVGSLSLRGVIATGGAGSAPFSLSSEGGPGMKATNCGITAWGCDFTGGLSIASNFDFIGAERGADGADLSSSPGYFLSCHFKGSNGGDSGYPGTFPSGGGDGIGAPGALAGSCVLASCTFEPGVGGFDPQFGSGPNGVDVNPPSAATYTAEAPLAFAGSSPVREQQTIAFDLELGAPGFAYFAYDVAPVNAVLFPGIRSPFLLDVTTAILIPFPGGPSLTAGTYGAQFIAPDLPVSVLAVTAYAQALFVDGGFTYIQFGPLTAITLLDSTL